MTLETLNKIQKLLCSVMDTANKKCSIEEKRAFYYNFLERAWPCLDINDEFDIKSQELEEFICDNFLNIEVEKPKIFEEVGFVPWLDNARKGIAWDYYNRYEQYLLNDKSWKPITVANIQTSSDIILDHIANPRSPKYFGKIGLVIGDIQSGKTANYTAVINKAIDAGYKIIIVLAGMTRDLRNQTQKRLDMEVLGYETKTSGKGNTIGVGKIRQLSIEGLTYSDEKRDFGDLKKYFASYTLDNSLNPIVAIVKKNKSVLNNLWQFLMHSQSSCYTDKKLDIPVLIIDDEVDQASVDTKDSESIEGASAINQMIRKILNCLNRYSYVGYTATPFANVLINPDRDDIYPKDFILTIPSNEDYCGIKEYFGIDVINDEELSCDSINDLVVNIKDYDSLFDNTKKINAKTEASELSPSLKEAIKSFILASSIKKSRGINENNSMLIHIARFKIASQTLRPLVQDYINELYIQVKYRYQNAVKEFKRLWENRFEKVSMVRLGKQYNDQWEKIANFLLPTLMSILNNILVINGDSDDFLDYSSSINADYIIIGGDKLSRGLTLEGLVVSYYYRNCRAYDSLLQMGRWFGYKKGWIDVCRVYTTVRFLNNFINVGKVLQRFKNDIDDMYRQKLNPREVGQRIMYSPNLIPTARNKMKNTTKMKVSFSGQIQQLITFDRKNIKDNLDCANSFISSLKDGEFRKNKVVFKNVLPDQVLKYLSSYKECSNYIGYGHISIQNWINYIKKLVEKDELINWTVVLHSLKDFNHNSIIVGSHKIYKPEHALRDAGSSSSFDFYNVKNIANPEDFVEFFDVKSKEYKSIKYYSPEREYPGFDEKHALMAIYVFDLYELILTDKFDQKKNRYIAERGDKIIDGQNASGPAIWFPHTKDYEKSATTYYVSKDYKDLEEKQEKEDREEFGETIDE